MVWIEIEWEVLSMKTISNCCNHLYRDGNRRIVFVADNQRDLNQAMTGAATEKHAPFTRVGIDSLLDTQGEDECTENVGVDLLAAQVANITTASDDCNEEGSDSEEEDNPITLKEEMWALAIALNVLEKYDKINFEIRKAIRNTQRKLRIQTSASMHQGTVSNYFQNLKIQSSL